MNRLNLALIVLLLFGMTAASVWAESTEDTLGDHAGAQVADQQSIGLGIGQTSGQSQLYLRSPASVEKDLTLDQRAQIHDLSNHATQK